MRRTVQAPARELAPRRVERQQPVTGDVGPALNEGPALTAAAEPERFEPHDGEHAEAVVELRRVHVGRREVGALPHGGCRVSAAAIVVMSSNWSQLGRPRRAVPTALIWTAGWSRSPAT